MRALLIISVLFLLVLVVFIPIAYLWTASGLPPLESEFDLERHLRGYVEGERMAVVSGMSARDRPPVDFVKPDLTHFPKDLVAAYLSAWDCPTYFQTPRESGAAWAWRLISLQLTGREPAGDGKCERQFAANIAAALKIPPGGARAIAAHKIHGLLQKDQLVAYDLATIYFEPAVIGADDAAKRLLQRKLDALALEQVAELAIAMPPYYYWTDFRLCRSASQLRQSRDIFLEKMFRDGLIPEDRLRLAQAQPVTCAAGE